MTEIKTRTDWAAIAKALTRRKPAIMFALGAAQGLPVALVLGTLTAWLGEAGVDLATIGVLTWVGLAYAFRFLWSPIVDRAPPLLAWLGRRRGWLVLCQVIIAGALLVLALIGPSNLGLFALAAVAAAFAGSTQDTVIDAWRIEVADEDASLDLLSTIVQLGYRTASLAGGAGALVLSSRLSWQGTYALFAVVMGLAILASLAAPEPEQGSARGRLGEALRRPGELQPRVRNAALIAVLLGWSWAIVTLAAFMFSVVNADPADPNRPSARTFMSEVGPFIVLATVVGPATLAGWLEWLRRSGRRVLAADPPPPSQAQASLDHLYGAIVQPLADIIGRLGWGAILVLALVLTYRLTDSIWGPLAFPFYLGELKYTADEVAFASKIFGVIMTIAGIALAGATLVWLGRMLSLVLGAIMAAATNLLYADLALGGPFLTATLQATGLGAVFGWFGVDLRMSKLMLAIAGENIAGGFAGVAYVAYLSSLVSKQYSAVQYALLFSLTLLIGALGRGPLGEAIEEYGYAPVFYFTAALGLIAVIASLAEWARLTASAQKPSRDPAPAAAAE